MCNLYSHTKPLDAVRQHFGLVGGAQLNLPDFPAIFPGAEAPVIRSDASGARRLDRLSWGFVMPQAGRAPKRVTNARDDKVAVSPFWRGSFEERRCLAPATSFCEPKGRNPAVWHWFALRADTVQESGDPRPLFAFAGLWRRWRGVLKGETVALDTFAILTTTPNALVAPVHPSRMPVIIAPEDFDLWLHGAPEAAHALAQPYPADKMRLAKAGAERADGLAPEAAPSAAPAPRQPTLFG